MPDPAEPALRVFLDANVLYSAALGGKLVRLFDLAGVRLVTNEYALGECWHNLAENEEASTCRDRLEALLVRVEIVPYDITAPLFCPWSLADANDVPILMGAIEARCTHLLTGDARCFGPYFGRVLDGVTILRPGDFLRMHQEP